MKTKATVSAIFHSSLERAFKTPILGDVTKFLVGYGPVPAVVKITDDATWEKPGGTRIPSWSKELASNGGPIGIDQVYVQENTYWEWGGNFPAAQHGFHMEFRGQMSFTEQAPEQYGWRDLHLVFPLVLAYPFHWFFTKVFWRGQMKRP